MRTTSISVCSLCIPCHCRCRYCLLSWDGSLPGADYERCEGYAKRFHSWLKENRPELGFTFYFGYSMEHPRLFEAISFAQSLGSPPGRFLQFDGMAFRPQAQLRDFLSKLREAGIELIDLTFYGVGQYHDRFAGRQGDFDYLLRVLSAANDIGLDVQLGLPLTAESAPQAGQLLDIWGQYDSVRRSLFVPHAEGRGKYLEPIRFSDADFACLDPRAKALVNTSRFKSEAQWLSDAAFPEYENRALGLVLTRENMEQFEAMPFDEAIAYLEKLDEDYYAALPSLPELAERYGDKENLRWYSLRDLHMKYQRRFIEENGLIIHDINDERWHFSRRF